jgi:methylated-DNA-protein-cysteine methyltransferase-like protein
MTLFKDRVVRIIRSIPQGKVVSYGQVALYAGLPRAAREVGWILRASNEGMPWWRVINNKGVISIEGNWQADKRTQKQLLEAEGVVVSDTLEVDMEKYRHIASQKELEQFQLDPAYIQKVIEKYSSQEKLL